MDIKRVSAGLHGNGNADEVLVALEVNGEAKAHLLRDVPELARRYRTIRREERDTARTLDEKRASAASDRNARTKAADEALYEARRAFDAAQAEHRKALELADESFQLSVDAIVDETKAAQDTRAAARKAIDDEAFALAEEQVRAQDAARIADGLDEDEDL